MEEYTMERLRRATRLDSIPFDEDMIPIITELNEKGYKTFACCQGHTNENGWYGYLLFSDIYDFAIKPPLFRVGLKYHKLVGAYSQVRKKGRALYWIGNKSKRTSIEEKELERKQWIKDLYDWSLSLPSLK